MRRVLLDESTPADIRRFLTECHVDTVPEIGWAGLTNGDLIAAADNAGYAVMVTCDQNIRHQQNMANRKLALVVLETNRSLSIRAEIDLVTAAIRAADVGSWSSVAFARPVPRRRVYPPDPAG